MEFAQLEIFKAVCEEGSIARAAEKLHRVPSNLTTRIKQLEAELGAELFIRERQRLRVSAVGQQFLRHAQQILALAESARHVAGSGQPGGAFALGSLESTAAVRIPELLAAYHKRHPDVILDVSTGTSGDMVEGVLNGSYLAAFTDGPLEHPDLDGAPAFKEELVVISPAGRKRIRSAIDASGETIFAFRDRCSYRRRFEQWLADGGVVPSKIIEMESYHGMLACVAAGSGIALMPRALLESLSGRKGVTAHRLAPAHGQVETWLIWRRGRGVPANVAALLDVLESRA